MAMALRWGSTGSVRSGARALGGACLAGIVLLLLASAAEARVERLRWEDPNASGVAGFNLYVGSAPGVYGTPVDVGRPSKDSSGAHFYDLTVADAATIFVAVTAYDSQRRESAFSNERSYSPPSTGGDPAPEPEPEPAPEPEPSPSPGDGGDTDTGGGGGDTGSGGGGGTGGDTGSGGDSGGGGTGGGSGDPALIWSENFEALPTGNAVPSWMDTRNNGASQDDSLFRVASVSGNKVLTTSSTDAGLHSHYHGPGSAGWTAYEMRGRMRINDADGRIGVTAYSQYPSADVYYSVSTAWQTGEFEIHGHPNPWVQEIGVSCVSKRTGVVAQPNVWYRYRLLVEVETDVTRIRAKVWEDGRAQPSGWQADCSHELPELPYKGTVGVWSGRSGSKFWDDFEVIDIFGGSGQLEPQPIGPPGRPRSHRGSALPRPDPVARERRRVP